MSTSRARLKANVNRFVEKFGQPITFKTYSPSAAPATAPYRQRIRQYDAPIQVTCLLRHGETEDVLSDIGNASLPEYQVCTGPDQLLAAYQPNVNDPRILRDPSTLVSTKDVVEIYGVEYRIYSKVPHGDDGEGPLWYIFHVRRQL